jgi:glycosyltransferase involved in cell wall biosynthesis
VLDLKQRIWPAIREKLPEVNLYIYGAYCDTVMLKLHNEKEGFFVIGPVEQAKDAFVKARVCLAPLRFGAGQKGKLFEAMLYGTPSITTHLGAESMHGNLPWNGFITDDFSVFVEESVRLYSNRDLWSGAQSNGIEILNTCFNKENYASAFFNKLETLKDNLVLYRNKNFIGSMLMAETAKSTKYLSKWIEEKNKKK